MIVAVTGARSDIAASIARAAGGAHTVVLAPPAAELDVLDPVERWEAWLNEAEPDAVIHLAARKPPVPEDVLIRVNAGGTARLCAALDRASPRAALVIASSAAVYGHAPAGAAIATTAPLRPVNPYGRSKVAQEETARASCATHGRRLTIARIFNIVGAPNDHASVLPALVTRLDGLVDGAACALRDGSAVRDFIDVDDVARALLLAAVATGAPDTMNVGTEVPVTVAELAERARAALGKRVTFDNQERDDDSHIAWSLADAAETRSLGWAPRVPLETTIDGVIRREARRGARTNAL
jgi:nucleoside-diphosphate-sugar epimerase